MACERIAVSRYPYSDYEGKALHIQAVYISEIYAGDRSIEMRYRKEKLSSVYQWQWERMIMDHGGMG